MPSTAVGASAGPPDVVVLEGHLTQPSLEAALSALRPRHGSTLIVDCTTMTGYDPDARAFFVDWHRRQRDYIGAVAIVTDKMLWHMIVGAMALASGQRMRAFATLDEARAWIAG